MLFYYLQVWEGLGFVQYTGGENVTPKKDDYTKKKKFGMACDFSRVSNNVGRFENALGMFFRCREGMKFFFEHELLRYLVR